MSSFSVSRLCYTFKAMFSSFFRFPSKVRSVVALAAVSLLAAACGGSTSLTTPTSPTVTSLPSASSVPSTSSPETSLPPGDSTSADALVSAAELLGDDGAPSSPFAASVDRLLLESSDLDPAVGSFLRSLGPGPFVSSEFAELVSSTGLIYRVVELDGQPLMLTMDYRTDRLNVVVVGGMVVSISSVS